MAWEQDDKVVGSPQPEQSSSSSPAQHYTGFLKVVQQDTLAPAHYHTGLVLLRAQPAWGLCCGNAVMHFGVFIRTN